MILRRKAVRFDFGSRRIQSTEMADHQHSEESLVDKVSEKLHKRSSSSSSSSDDEKPPVSHQPSKSVNRTVGRKKSVHNCLGGRKAADLFLWRDKKRSASILAGATVLWILFECMEYHFLTFVCHVLILSLAILFIWINSAAFLKRSPPHIPEIAIPEDAVHNLASELRFEVNRVFAVLHEVATGRDLKKYLLVVASLWLLSVVGSWCDFLTLAYIVLVGAHTVPFVYEKYQDQIDSFAHKVSLKAKEQYKVIDAKILKKIPRGPAKDKKHL